MLKSEIKENEYDAYFGRYIHKLSDTISLKNSLTDGLKEVYNFFNAIPSEKLNYRYQPEKWSIKEVFQHLIDTERIFSYRCFRIARRDTTPLPSFNQDIYVSPSKANDKCITQLLIEFRINRTNTISIIDSLSYEDLSFIGNVSGNPMSARAAAFIIPGHDIWHMEIIKERYL